MELCTVLQIYQIDRMCIKAKPQKQQLQKINIKDEEAENGAWRRKNCEHFQRKYRVEIQGRFDVSQEFPICLLNLDERILQRLKGALLYKVSSYFDISEGIGSTLLLKGGPKKQIIHTLDLVVLAKTMCFTPLNLPLVIT